MASYHFWIPRLHQGPTTAFSPQSTGNQYTQISTYIGTGNHFITAKNSVYNTLAYRAKVVSITPEDFTKELGHLKKALMDCQFPNWALNRLQQQFQLNTTSTTTTYRLKNKPTTTTKTATADNKTKTSTWSYLTFKGLGEKFKRICNKQGIQVHFKIKHSQTTTYGPKGQGP